MKRLLSLGRNKGLHQLALSIDQHSLVVHQRLLPTSRDTRSNTNVQPRGVCTYMYLDVIWPIQFLILDLSVLADVM